MPLLFENKDERHSPERSADRYTSKARYAFPDKNYTVFTAVAFCLGSGAGILQCFHRLFSLSVSNPVVEISFPVLRGVLFVRSVH
jgi:hypothetical protein